MCNCSAQNRPPLTPAAQAAARANRAQAVRNRALYEAGALPGLRPGCGRAGRTTGRQGRATSCGSTSPTLTQELYAPAIAEVETTTCCDAVCGCRSFNRSWRNSYWPAFCHPRWLTCDELYCNRR